MASFTLELLDQYLLLKSYILGFLPSLADVAVYEKINKSELDASTNSNAKRWYKHISSYSASEIASFTGKKEVPVDLLNFKPDESLKASKPTTNEDDFDLFGDDDEDAAAAKASLEKAKSEKKAKAAVVAKSTIVFDIKPLDDETDLDELKQMVLGIKQEGLRWGETRLEDICFGLKKLVVSAEIEDAKVSTDDLEEKITNFEDHVQSVDIASFQKV